jgi:magnesium-transporting ATPase (P-type)
MLKLSGIESKIITGDNIYIAIETAVRCSIIGRAEELVVIEGKEQLKADVGFN